MLVSGRRRAFSRRRGDVEGEKGERCASSEGLDASFFFFLRQGSMRVCLGGLMGISWSGGRSRGGVNFRLLISFSGRIGCWKHGKVRLAEAESIDFL